MKKYIIRLNGKEYEVEVVESKEVVTSAPVATPAVSTPAPVATAPAPAPQASTGTATPVTSPMLGLLMDVKVSVGQAVKQGDVVAILEAMKIQSDIVAPVAGTVTQIARQKGDNVDSGDAILYIS